MKPPQNFIAVMLLVCCAAATAQQENMELRGGWMADIEGQRHILYIVMRDGTVSGIYCHDCHIPGNLAFVDDGELDSGTLRFALYHYPEGATPYTEQVAATLAGEELQARITGVDGQVREVLYYRTPPEERTAAPVAEFRGNRPVDTATRMLPAPPEQVTLDKIVGLWLWGTGPAKQYFIFRQHKDGVRGMVCGPCDTVFDVAPLEQISMQGTNLHFEIVHEDNGGGFEQYGPFSNVTDAQISRNEMHITSISSWMTTANRRAIEMTLLGPVVSGN